MIVAFAPMNVSAATSDTFDITVTGEFLWIDITNATWAIGTVAMSSSTYTNETGVTFIADMDNCTVITDLKLQITIDGATWNDGTAPNADVYRLNASIDVWVADDDNVAEVSANTISSSIAAGNNETFDLRFDAPTSTTVGTEQSITVTATITKS